MLKRWDRSPAVRNQLLSGDGEIERRLGRFLSHWCSAGPFYVELQLQSIWTQRTKALSRTEDLPTHNRHGKFELMDRELPSIGRR